jgi:hypothetical protein
MVMDINVNAFEESLRGIIHERLLQLLMEETMRRDRFQALSIEDKVALFVKKGHFLRLQNKEIASFLGITPQYLCLLKKKFAFATDTLIQPSELEYGDEASPIERVS